MLRRGLLGVVDEDGARFQRCTNPPSGWPLMNAIVWDSKDCIVVSRYYVPTSIKSFENIIGVPLTLNFDEELGVIGRVVAQQVLGTPNDVTDPERVSVIIAIDPKFEQVVAALIRTSIAAEVTYGVRTESINDEFVCTICELSLCHEKTWPDALPSDVCWL